tara:strand:+ start:5 stop:1522 length:1518 start_codon:yes stop_codon:yes gene_type:complete
LASVDKFGAAFAIGFMAVMLGVMSGLASDTATPDRPGAEQQAAISPPPMPKPVDKESMVGYGDAMKPKPVGDERCWIEDPVTGEKVRGPSDVPAPPRPGVDWDYCNLDGHDYTGENLEGATIRHASAVETNFSETILNGVQFGHSPSDYVLEHPHTDATGAKFIKAAGKEVDFERTTLNDAIFIKSKMPRVDFNHAGMMNVDMRDAYMPEANFVRATTIHSDLERINLKYSDMSRVNLESSNLSNALLIEVTFDQGLLVDAQFIEADMKGSTLRDVNGSAGGSTTSTPFARSSFEGANMQETMICGDFHDATFEDADVRNSIFNDTSCVEEITRLEGTNLHNADFMGVFIPDPPSFPSMITGMSSISDEHTDRSCLHHPFCDLEPIPHGEDTAPPPPEPETVPSAPFEVIIVPAEGSFAPGCEATECFIPSHAIVAEGGTVIFRNTDSSSHTFTHGTMYDGPGGIWDSRLIMSGGEYSVSMDYAGEYDYFCMVHPWRTGSIEVIG